MSFRRPINSASPSLPVPWPTTIDPAHAYLVPDAELPLDWCCPNKAVEYRAASLVPAVVKICPQSH
jgi:hypothetical protein